MNKPAKQQPPAAWFEQALKSHDQASALLHKAKNHAILAGWFFLQARNACAHGEWEDIVKQFEGKISYRTVRAYIQFTEDALVSVVAEKRKLTDEQVKGYELTHRELADSALRDAAEAVVIQSAANFTELARELSLFRKFGSYDAVQHAAAKARAAKGQPKQAEFIWGLCLSGLASIKAIERLPFDRLEAAQLDTLEAELTHAQAAVQAAKANLHATPTGGTEGVDL